MAGALGVHEPSPAGRAVDRAPQIVRVLAVFFAVVSVRGQSVLDSQPDVRLNEHGMFSFIMDAPVRHDAHVIRVLQHVVERGESNVAGWHRWGGFTRQPLRSGRQQEIGGTPFACGVLLKAPAH